MDARRQRSIHSVQIPILSSLRELSPPPRKFLYFTGFNVVSWQCVIGPAMILLARRIDMPASWVGWLIAFLPFTQLLVIFTAPLVERVGAKRLMSSTWLARNLVACLIFILPWAVAHGGMRAGWYVMVVYTLGFSVLRAIGVSGWFPWLHEVVPESERGSYFSTESGLTQLVNVGVVLAQGFLLSGNPPIGRFLLIYGAGIVAGIGSLYWMLRVPGGEGAHEETSWEDSWNSYRVALSDGKYVRFVITASLCFSCTSWLGSAVVMYYRDMLKLSESMILVLMSASSLAVLLTIRYWGQFADCRGSGRAMVKTLSAHSLLALAFLAVTPGKPWTLPLLWVVAVLATVFGAALAVAMNRAMLNMVEEVHRVTYTNLWILGTSVTLGVTPILAGMFIDWWGMWGFRLCFIIAGVSGLLCAIASDRVVRDHPAGDRVLPNDPVMPLRMFTRTVSITVGMDESNR
jgi:hypothetical protein